MARRLQLSPQRGAITSGGRGKFKWFKWLMAAMTLVAMTVFFSENGNGNAYSSNPSLLKQLEAIKISPGGGGSPYDAAAASAAASAAAVESIDNVSAANNQEPPFQLSPFFSNQPSPASFHPKWKLWTEMNPAQQQQAMDEVGVYMQKYGAMIYIKNKRAYSKSILHSKKCVLDEKIGSTGHKICGPIPEQPCNFISFGINDDPSFDREMADHWGCRGFAGDPTVSHPSKLHEKVTFHNVGASMLQDNEERLKDKGGTTEWWSTSMPKLRYFLGLERIDLLKLDCEGCEMALGRDILREDPYFLTHVDQISIETHVSKAWMTTQEQVYYFGLMFPLLEEAGFEMEWSSVFGCSKRHEVPGCMPELAQYGWPCGYEPWPGKKNVVLGRSCQEFTWKRYAPKGP
jgi:hypothetical protein